MAREGAITPAPSSELRLFVEKQSGQKILRCYQCGKCTAGCPTAYTMDLGPRQIMRAVQLGLKQEVLSSSTIWLCLFCHTCTARCPLEIDISRVMESLRLLAAAEGSKPAEKEVKLFHTIFLRLVQRFGRIYEFGLGGLYNLLSRHPGTNAGMLPLMLAKGKLALLPPRARGVSQIRTLFARVEAKKRESMLSGDKVERK